MISFEIRNGTSFPAFYRDEMSVFIAVITLFVLLCMIVVFTGESPPQRKIHEGCK